MRRHPRNMHLPAPQMDEKEDVVGHQATQRPDLGGEKVGGDEHVNVRADTLLPRSRRLTLWDRWETMTFENVAHGLVTDRIPEVGQGADDSVIAPGAILLCHA